MKAEQARLDCIFFRTKLMQLFHQVNESSHSDKEESELREKMNKAEKKFTRWKRLLEINFVLWAYMSR